MPQNRACSTALATASALETTGVIGVGVNVHVGLGVGVGIGVSGIGVTPAPIPASNVALHHKGLIFWLGCTVGLYEQPTTRAAMVATSKTRTAFLIAHPYPHGIAASYSIPLLHTLPERTFILSSRYSPARSSEEMRSTETSGTQTNVTRAKVPM